jgi:hypothetical protein
MTKLRLLKRTRPLPGEIEPDELDIDCDTSKKTVSRLDSVYAEIRYAIAKQIKTYTSENYDQKFLKSLIPKR